DRHRLGPSRWRPRRSPPGQPVVRAPAVRRWRRGAEPRGGTSALRKSDDPGLSLKGSGLVFVATKDGEIRGTSRRGAGVYAWDTRHLSRYEVEPRTGTLRLRSAEVLPDGARLSYTFGRGVRVERRITIDIGISDEWSLANTGRRSATFD